MSMYGRDPWGGPLEIQADSATDDERSRDMDLDRAALSTTSRQLNETQQSWLLAGPGDKGKKKKKYVDLGCVIVSRTIFIWTVGTILACGFLAGLIALIVKTVPRHHPPRPPPDNYTVALHKALMFFNAQRCGYSLFDFFVYLHRTVYIKIEDEFCSWASSETQQRHLERKFGNEGWNVRGWQPQEPRRRLLRRRRRDQIPLPHVFRHDNAELERYRVQRQV